MYRGVKSVEAREDHKLLIRFDNDECRIFDVTPLLSIARFRELGILGTGYSTSDFVN